MIGAVMSMLITSNRFDADDDDAFFYRWTRAGGVGLLLLQDLVQSVLRWGVSSFYNDACTHKMGFVVSAAGRRLPY
jgi:hypothetical protein